MSWIMCEGLDRVGKSTVAAQYKKMGYTVIHMTAPDKKYFKPGYNGESYLEEMVTLYSKYEGVKVFWDRTQIGELIWPNVYGRASLLSEEDIEYLRSIENNNDAERILMYDNNMEAHWQRCIDNNEPLTRQQFGRANIFYERLVKDYGFTKKQLSDFPGLVPPTSGVGALANAKVSSAVQSVSTTDGNSSTDGVFEVKTEVGRDSKPLDDRMGTSSSGDSIEEKLEKANAIRSLLQGSILKKKGGAFDDIEQDLRDFLQGRLDELFEGPKPQKPSLSEEEVSILKLYVSRIKESMKK